MGLIKFLLALSAIYSGGMYLFVYYHALRGNVDQRDAELNTFHLGLCFILSLGFLGLMGS